MRMLQVGPSAFLLLEQLLTELHVTINPKANVIILFWCDPYTDIVVILDRSKIIQKDKQKSFEAFRAHTAESEGLKTN